MALGPIVRASFGPYERFVADLYRAIFLDISDFVQIVQSWVVPCSILEVGCGEGCVTEELTRAFPAAVITGIDITETVGRLYRGDNHRVKFINCNLEDLVCNPKNRYDLVVVNDVLHHVPQTNYAEFLKAVRESCLPSGNVVLKDWIKTPTPIHWLCEFSDRFITGDDVYYATLHELRDLLVSVFGKGAIRAEQSVRPWNNNRAFLLNPVFA